MMAVVLAVLSGACGLARAAGGASASRPTLRHNWGARHHHNRRLAHVVCASADPNRAEPDAQTSHKTYRASWPKCQICSG